MSAKVGTYEEARAQREAAKQLVDCPECAAEAGSACTSMRREPAIHWRTGSRYRAGSRPHTARLGLLSVWIQAWASVSP